MTQRKRIEITVETSLLVIRRSANQVPVWCIPCGSPAQFITPGQAAALARVNTRTLYRWVEADQLHLIETPGQPPLICLNSLLTLPNKGEKDDVTEHTDHHDHS